MKKRSRPIGMSCSRPSVENGGRVLSFRPGGLRGSIRPNGTESRAGRPNLDYSTEPEEAGVYRHRMLVNAGAVILIAMLIVAGLWLADALAKLRKNEDCALAGRHDCTQIEFVRRGKA